MSISPVISLSIPAPAVQDVTISSCGTQSRANSTGTYPPGVIDVGPYEKRDVEPPGIVYKGEQYQPNSNLLSVEGCVEDTCDCATRYYRWTGSRFKLILRQPVRMPAHCLKQP